MSFFLYPDARTDIVGLADYIAKDKPIAAEGFIDEFFTACDLLSDMPDIGTRVIEDYANINPLLKNARKWSMKRFSDVLIFYTKVDNGVAIIRVVSSRRDLKVLFST